MSTPYMVEIKQFLIALEKVQHELAQLFERKLAALTASKANELLRLAGIESGLSQQMRELLLQRQEILQTAVNSGMQVESLLDVVMTFGGDEREELQQRIASAQEQTDKLRHEGWVHWIIAHRAYNHHTELLDLIAHSGQKAATYSQTADHSSHGGAILDASI